MLLLTILFWIFQCSVPLLSNCATIQVGPSHHHKTLSSANSIIQDGDIVEIETGVYTDYVTISKNGVTIKGVGSGRAHFNAQGVSISNGKAIFVIRGNDVVVENIEFSGASVVDENGSGIRIEGQGKLTLRNCYFHDNENGILGGSEGLEVLVEFCIFDRNGASDGYTHNMYINHVDKFTLQHSITKASDTGHNVKSRAHQNIIQYNLILDTTVTPAPSRSIDVPNGGKALILGNIIQQSENTQNSASIGYGKEGLSNRAPHEVRVGFNTMVNYRHIGIALDYNSGSEVVRMENNLVVEFTSLVAAGSPGSEFSQAGNIFCQNCIDEMKFKDHENFEYEIETGSRAIGAAVTPSLDELIPLWEYVNPANRRERYSNNVDCVGAFDFHNEDPPSCSPGWSGSECEVCSDVYFCSGHGTCSSQQQDGGDSTTTCTCLDGWDTTLDCSAAADDNNDNDNDNDDDDSSNSEKENKANVGVIVGSVLGSIGGFVLLFIIVSICIVVFVLSIARANRRKEEFAELEAVENN